eukprot:scaffold125236_cov44-Prasinocladus_malaysianus.AAC.3
MIRGSKVSPFLGGGAGVNEGADEADVEQLRLINTPGTMWNLVRASTDSINQLLLSEHRTFFTLYVKPIHTYRERISVASSRRGSEMSGRANQRERDIELSFCGQKLHLIRTRYGRFVASAPHRCRLSNHPYSSLPRRLYESEYDCSMTQCFEPNTEQVSKAEGSGSGKDVEELRKLFPNEPSTKYSLKWLQAGGQEKPSTPEDLEQVRRLLDSIEHAQMTENGKNDLSKHGVFYIGPVVSDLR